MISFYRAMLWLYPAGFRREYGVAMTEIFAERASETGAIGRIALLLSAIPDVLGNALALHWEMLRQDLRYSARTLAGAPGFALTAILVTALGVGANTAAFSVADFVLVRPLGFPDAHELVRLCEGPRHGPSGWGCMNQFSPANYRDFKERTTSFESMGAFQRDAVNLVGGGDPQRLNKAAVTAEVFPLLGVQPVLGGVLDPNTLRADARSVVLSYGLWQSRFGGDPAVLGRVVNLDGAPHTVVGVMPSTFIFPTRDVQLWTPLQLVEEDYLDRGNSYIEGVARLSDGVSFERAAADLNMVVEQLARDYPEAYAETGVSFFRLRDEFSPRFRLMLQALCGASLCILLLACANLANLLLVRAAARERELAVRAALGAGKERLVRQMITESITLAAIGGGAGVLVSMLIFPLLSLLVPTTMPIGSEPSLDFRLLVLAALFTALTGLGFGVIPALRAGGRASFSMLRSRASHKRRHQSVLVAIEVGASVVLLVSSGLLIRAMLRVEAVEPGFRTEGVLALHTALPKPKYMSAEKREQFYRQVLSEVRVLPGVHSAAYISGLPMVLTGGIARVTLPHQEVRPDGEYSVSRRYVTPQFFRTLSIPMVSGRDLEDADYGERGHVAVVSESFVRRYWPDGDALGKTFLFREQERTVVGVVRDIKVRGLERTSEPQMYLPASHSPESTLTAHDPKDLVIRTSGDVLAILPAVREIIRRADRDQPISNVRPLSDIVAAQTAPRRAQVSVLGALAAVALLLAGLGINGLLAYTVTQQRREIGVRLALGEEPQRIARRIVWNGVSIVLLGMVPGLLIAFVAGRSMSTLLFGVLPTDPITMIVTVGLCICMSITGALLPARRALRVSPMTVMRSE